jgi:hypothetical protein
VPSLSYIAAPQARDTRRGPRPLPRDTGPGPRPSQNGRRERPCGRPCWRCARRPCRRLFALGRQDAPLEAAPPARSSALERRLRSPGRLPEEKPLRDRLALEGARDPGRVPARPRAREPPRDRARAAPRVRLAAATPTGAGTDAAAPKKERRSLTQLLMGSVLKYGAAIFAGSKTKPTPLEKLRDELLDWLVSSLEEGASHRVRGAPPADAAARCDGRRSAT